MGVLVAFLHRYLSPFVAGACVAGVAVADNVPMAAVLLSAAALSGYFSLPAGGRVIGRMTGEPS